MGESDGSDMPVVREETQPAIEISAGPFFVRGPGDPEVRSGRARWRPVLEDTELETWNTGPWSESFPTTTLTVEFVDVNQKLAEALTGGPIAVDPPKMVSVEAARDYAEQLAEQRFLQLIEAHSFETCTMQDCRLCAELSKAKEMGIIAARDNLVDRFWEKVLEARGALSWTEASADMLQNRIRKKLGELREIDPHELW